MDQSAHEAIEDPCGRRGLSKPAGELSAALLPLTIYIPDRSPRRAGRQSAGEI